MLKKENILNNLLKIITLQVFLQKSITTLINGLKNTKEGKWKKNLKTKHSKF
jgi:hypothetical protein